MDVKLSPSKEDYLKAIHSLEEEQQTVRVKDIADRLDITRPSVSAAVKNLEKQGYVCHPRYDLVGLTPEGSKIAEAISHRHQVIKNFLSQVLGLDDAIAEKDACGMEHTISPETFESLARFMETCGVKSATS